MAATGAFCAVIPCLNEARHIGDVVAGVRRHLAHVLVVDDGSSDDTATRAATAGAEVLRHANSRGKGAALATGLARADQAGALWALCLDGDGQHASEDIPTFLAAAARTSASLIIGNRFAQPLRMPPLRRSVNRLMSWLIGSLVGCDIPDSQCGFRLIQLDLWRRLNLASRRFEVESEMIVAGLRCGSKIEFVPVRSVYGDETSKISPVRDGWRWLQWYRGALRNRNSDPHPTPPNTNLRSS